MRSTSVERQGQMESVNKKIIRVKTAAPWTTNWIMLNHVKRLNQELCRIALGTCPIDFFFTMTDPAVGPGVCLCGWLNFQHATLQKPQATRARQTCHGKQAGDQETVPHVGVSSPNSWKREREREWVREMAASWTHRAWAGTSSSTRQQPCESLSHQSLPTVYEAWGSTKVAAKELLS